MSGRFISWQVSALKLIITRIISNILTVLYQASGVSFLLAVLVTFLYLYAVKRGKKKGMIHRKESFCSDCRFLSLFFLAFYTSLVLFRTLLNRRIWPNPLSDVIGIWGIYNSRGELTTEMIENILLFIPLLFLIFLCFHDNLFHRAPGWRTILWTSLKLSFLCSFGIESTQLILRLGTFQLSDLFDNTLGGVLGGLIYFAFYQYRHGNII